MPTLTWTAIMLDKHGSAFASEVLVNNPLVVMVWTDTFMMEVAVLVAHVYDGEKKELQKASKQKLKQLKNL